MICDICGLEMYRDMGMLVRMKRDVITYRCECGNYFLKGVFVERFRKECEDCLDEKRIEK